MNLEATMQELESLAKPMMKKRYLSNGAREPLYGVATGAMKPMARRIKKDQALAEQLYATGNYDAMYFAGVIADPAAMTADDFERWMDEAYFFMVSDYVVAVTLSETDIAQQVADKWIASGDELRRSAGWSCYCWLLGSRPDEQFDAAKLAAMLDQVEQTLRTAPPRAQHAMNNFLYTVAISYVPLHGRALELAESLGPIEVRQEGHKKSTVLHAAEGIHKALARGQLGFKRSYVRC
ncbi:DNA alkylation repair protein [Paenibacillus sp. IB182496]|uniref:DNA alkylation repair protein n=1 Tax=Paenibacillus sabuli TaxID=2772509 RepID=A0A927GRM0_9BACL|nr:DNA alkylation repair protein [Paenibacillus sabuli]MBD2845401.1 DNA alkylation repair protein [Paenibacillus sabuli]